MNKLKIIAMINFRPVTVISDGTKEGTTIDAPDEEQIKMFHASIRHEMNISMGGHFGSPRAVAGYDTPIGITAAVFSIAPQHTHLIRAPKK